MVQEQTLQMVQQHNQQMLKTSWEVQVEELQMVSLDVSQLWVVVGGEREGIQHQETEEILFGEEVEVEVENKVVRVVQVGHQSLEVMGVMEVLEEWVQ